MFHKAHASYNEKVVAFQTLMVEIAIHQLVIHELTKIVLET